MTIVSFKQTKTNANGLVIAFDDLTVVPTPKKLKKHFLVLEAKDSAMVILSQYVE